MSAPRFRFPMVRRRRSRRVSFLLLNTLPALLCLVAPLAAREIPVNDPTDLKQALKSVQPGDALLLREGEWKDTELTVEATGTPALPITLRARTPGRTVFTGASALRIGGEHLVISGLRFEDGAMPGGHVVSFRARDEDTARNCRLTDCAFLDYNPRSRELNSYWVSLYGVSNRVDHCRFQGKNDGSPTVTVWVENEPNYHQIDHNQFIHRPPLGRNGGETMRVGDSKMSLHNSRTLVEHNYFEDCSGEGEIISNKSCENIYRHNAFVECQGALVLRHGHRCRVEANWFLGGNRDGTGGIRIIGEDHRIVNNYLDSLAGSDFESAMPFVNGIPQSKLNEYYQVKRAVVAFNTLVNCTQNITFGAGVGRRNRAEPPLDCLIANNLIVSPHGPLIRIEDKPIGTRWLANIYYGAEIGLPPTEGLRELDPGLEKAADGFWHPGASSPAIGAAEGDFPDVTDDIQGNSRGSSKDVGCFQVATGAARILPPGRMGTGPGWE